MDRLEGISDVFVKQGSIGSVVTACVLLSGCGQSGRPAAPTQQIEALAPILGEPCCVRVISPKVTLISLVEPLAPGEETRPEPNRRFIAVGFPIGPQQAFAVDDYSIVFGKDEPRLPFAVGGENREAPDVFYDPEELAEVIQLATGSEEKNGVSTIDRDLGPQMVSWTTTASVLLLLFEVPADAKTLQLRHGKRSFQLSPDDGRIDGKVPALPPESRPAG